METVTEEVTFFFDGFEEQGEGDVSRPHTSDSGERTVGDASQPHTSDSGERTVAAKEIEATPTVTTKAKENDKSGGMGQSVKRFIRLFRYATALDWLLMFIGTISALLHGSSIPLVVYLYGTVLQLYFDHFTTSTLFSLTASPRNTSCTTTFPAKPGTAVQDVVSFLTNSTFNCNYNVSESHITFADVISKCYSDTTSCLSNADFIADINVFMVAVIALAVGTFLVSTLAISLFQITSERQVYKIRLHLYKSILRQDIQWFDANLPGSIASILTVDTIKLGSGIGDQLAIVISSLSTAVGGVILAFSIDWRIALFALSFTPISVVNVTIRAKLYSWFARHEQKEYASAGAVAEEVLSSIKTVVAFGGEKKEAARYEQTIFKSQKLGPIKGIMLGTSDGFNDFILLVMYSSVFWFGGYLISIGVTLPGTLPIPLLGVILAAYAISNAAKAGDFAVTAAAVSEGIYLMIDLEPAMKSAPSEEGGGNTLDGSAIDFSDVRFSYPTRPDVQVLNGFSLRVEVGQTVALVGPSGGGKSTVMQLLQRFYDPDEGKVLVGEKDLRSVSLKCLREHIGIVSQEPVLFDTTISENIRYGKESAVMEEIIEAAKNANAHDFISEFPNGYDTLVGEGGTQLSGGQKQRIAIARALVRNPKILLLDEATSALDTESEAIVQAALDRASVGRTTVIIAHRLSTIRNVDIIVSIEDGRLIEMGSHSELIEREGLYYKMVKAQQIGGTELSTTETLFYTGSTRHKRRPHQLSSSFRQRAPAHHPMLRHTLTDPNLMTSVQPKISPSTCNRQLSKSSLTDAPLLSPKPEPRRSLALITQASSLSLFDVPPPNEMITEADVKEVPIWRVLQLNAKEWWIIVIGVIGGVIQGLYWPLLGLLYGEILSAYALPPDEVLESLHLFCGILFAIGAVIGVSVFFREFCFGVSGERMTNRLRSRVFKAMLRQEVGWFDEERNSTSALTTILSTDISQVKEATGPQVGILLYATVSVLSSLVISFVYSWSLTLIILGVVPLLIVAGAIQAWFSKIFSAKQREALEKAGEIVLESIENIRTVYTLDIGDTLFSHYREELDRPSRYAIIYATVYGLAYGFSQSILILAFAILIRYGAFQVTRSPDSPIFDSFIDIFRVVTTLTLTSVTIGKVSAYIPFFNRGHLSANQVFAVLDRNPLVFNYHNQGNKLDSVIGEVVLYSVEFAYPSRPEHLVLNSIFLSVSHGKTLALVGPSGSGKSTVAALAERFYDPLHGKVTLDGSDIKVLNLEWYRSQIGIVSQEPVLFNTSVAENIRYGANFREVSDEEVIEAAKSANIHNFIDSLPQGYGTNVGAKGTQMSGGQKQRIAIARALVRDPKILLLDEATSALDTESEKIVQEALDRAREGRTCIVIAHRLSTIYHADSIAVIKDGKVVEQGTHSDLLEKKGLYYKLNKTQSL